MPDPLNDSITDDHLIKARGTGDLESLRRKLWRACRACEQLMFESGASRKQILQAVYALARASSEWRKVHEQHELEERITRLENYATNGYAQQA